MKPFNRPWEICPRSAVGLDGRRRRVEERYNPVGRGLLCLLLFHEAKQVYYIGGVMCVFKMMKTHSPITAIVVDGNTYQNITATFVGAVKIRNLIGRTSDLADKLELKLAKNVVYFDGIAD